MSRVTRREPEELMLRDFLDLLRRQKLTIGIVMIACIAVAIGQGLVSSPVYRSSIELLVEGRTPNSPQPDLYDPLNQVTTQTPSTLDVATEIELLESPAIVGKALEKAGISAPRPNDEAFAAMVTVEPAGTTNVLRVNVDSTVPENSLNMARALPAVFNDHVIRTRRQQVENAIGFLNEKLKQEKKRLGAAEVTLEDFKKGKNVQDMEIEKTMRAEKANRSDLENVLSQRDLYAAKARLDTAIAARKALPEEEVSNNVKSNADAIEAQKKIVADLGAQRAQLLQRYQPTSQAMQKIDAEIRKQTDYLNSMPKELKVPTRVRNPLLDSFDTQVAEARFAYQAAQAACARVGVWASATSKGMAIYSSILRRQKELQRGVDDAQASVMLITRNLADLEVRAQTVRQPAEAISDAAKPFQIRPNWAKNLALAILVGLALSISLAVIRDKAGDRVVSVVETDQLVGALPLGYIPALPRKVIQSMAPREQMDPDVKALPGKTMTVPEVALESYRILRANMAFSTQGAPVKSVLITSTSPGEGKTMVATNLAVALAADGKRVIVVDCNLRRPALHQMFHVKDTPGLGDVLLGRGTLGDVLQPTSVPGLSVISAGMETLSASELFGSPAMLEFHRELVENCDIAILDGAQCARVSDAQVLSSVAEGVLYVVQLGVPKKASMRFGIGLLKRANARIIGIVYNKLRVNEDNAPQV